MLKTYNQITFIREMRDDLHQKLMIWEEIIAKWEIDMSQKSKGIREAVRSTYRFVAYNFRKPRLDVATRNGVGPPDDTDRRTQ